MATTKIQTGAFPADVVTTAAIDDLSVTHAKLHTAMDLSSKTVTLPTLTSNVNIDVADLFVKDTTGGALGQVQIGAGTVQGFINIQKGDGTRTVQVSSDGDTYFNAGKVGIGTTSPDRALHIEGSDFSSSSIRLKRTSGGTSNDAGLQFQSAAGANTDTGLGGIWFQNSLDGNAYALIRARTDDSTGTSGRLDFMTSTSLVNNSSTPSLTIKSSGNVGIGTTSPGQKLTVAGGIESTSAQGSVAFYSTTAGSYNQQNGTGGTAWAYGSTGGNSAPNTAASTTFGFHHWNGSAWSNPLNVLTSGNVGIGTTSPGAKLHVNGASTRIQVSDSGTSFTAQDFLSNSNAVRATIGVERSSGGGLFVGSSAYAAVFGTASNGDTQFATNNNIRMTLDSSGNVGIGTVPSNPDGFDRILQVHGTNSAVMRFTGSTYGVGANDGVYMGFSYGGLEIVNPRATGYTRFQMTGGEAMRIDSAGRVGIATGGAVNTNAHANADDLVIGNTSNRTGMTIVSDPAQNGNIHFSDGTSTGNANIKGQFTYEHSDNSFRFYVNSTTEVLRLTSSGGTVFNNGQDINQNFTVKANGNANAFFIDGNGGNVGIGTTSPVSDLHVDGSIVSTNLAQGTGQLQIQGYGATGYINMNGSGSLRFRMGTSYLEHMSLAPGGQLLASAAGRYTGLNSNAWVTFGRLYSAQSTPLNIKVIVGHNSSGGYNEFTNDTYAYNIAAGTVVTIGNTTGGYTCQIRKIKRIGGQNGIPGAHYNGGDGGWEYQVARNQAYGMSVGFHVMGATTGWTWTI